jgi:hypothetical protein
LPRWLSWGALAVVVVAALVVPAARTKLADHAAAWLRTEWALSTSYDDARFAAIEVVDNRAGVLDDPVVESAARATDTEEADALRRIASAMAGHRMWSTEGDHARDAAVASVRDQIAALRRDAQSRHPSTTFLVAPGHDRLASRATARINALAKHAGLRPEKQAPAVTLRPDQAALSRLSRLTDFATGLSLLLSGPEQLEIVDLDTGRRTTLRTPDGEGDIQAWAGRIMVVNPHGVDAYDASGHLTTHFADDNAEVLSRSGPTLWLGGQRGVRQFAANGRPLTPWIAPPPGRSPVVATGNAVVTFHVMDGSGIVAELWTPTTGAIRKLPSTCLDNWAVASRTIVPLPCGGDRAVTTVDAVTGELRGIRLPGPVDESAAETFNPLSPNGHVLTVTLAHLGLRSGLLDLRTGRYLPAPGGSSLTPAAWSVDGRWVLLADGSSFGNGRKPGLALWRPDDGRTTSVRLAPGDSLFGGMGLLTNHRG